MSSGGAAVVVTGAAGGIGKAICRMFAAQGSGIVGVDKGEAHEAGFREALAQFQEQRQLFVPADVSDSDEVHDCFERIKREVGTVRTLVNCAGIREISSSLDLPSDVWRQVVDTNLSGTFYCSQTAVRSVLASGSSIVNVSSVAGLIGIGSRPAYTATKHGILGLTRCFARDFAGVGVRVNAVCPGIIRSPLTESYFSDEKFLAELRIFIPLGEVGEPEDVASAVRFLASDEARYITGVALPIDGGWSAEKGFSVGSEDSAYLASVLPTG